MFSKWEIKKKDITGSLCYGRFKDNLIISHEEGSIELFNVSCIVSQLTYKPIKSLSRSVMEVMWYSRIFGYKANSYDYLQIAESPSFYQEFNAILWTDKYIKNILNSEMQEPLVVPYLNIN